MASPESLLTELGGSNPDIGKRLNRISPLVVSFDSLAAQDGWIIDVGREETGAAFDDPHAEPNQRAINALLVACDYAVRRGAATVDHAKRLIKRESPIAIPDSPVLSESIRALVESLAINTLEPRAFQRRRRGHALTQPLRSDPALSFEQHSVDQNIGDNSSSSLTVHQQGAADRVHVRGQLNERWAVEVGLDPGVALEQVREIEREVPAMPSFLPGITSYSFDEGIVVGWRRGNPPDPHQLGTVIHAWTKALFDLALADVRLVFAPSSGASDELADMRARSASLRMYRDATIGAAPDTA